MNPIDFSKPSDLSTGRRQKKDATLLPVDKQIIVVFFAFILTLIVLLSSHMAYMFGFLTWGERLGWFGWSAGTSMILFIFSGLIVKAMESFLLTNSGLLGLDTVPLQGDIENFIKSLKGQILQYAVIIVLIGASVSVTMHGVSEGLRIPRMKNVVVKIDGLPHEFEGMKIVQLTDLHITSSIQTQWIRSVVDQVNAQKPDIIALTGDIIDGDYHAIHDQISVLADLKSSFGQFFVTGNHEAFRGAEEWMQQMAHLGMIVLNDDHYLINKGNATLAIAGISDNRGRGYQGPYGSNPVKTMKGIDSAAVKILLAHRPGMVYDTVSIGFDLQLSGHTHGGQLHLFRWLRGLTQPFQSGLFSFNNTKLYVSNGTGYWGVPIRIGAPSEITQIVLTGFGDGTPYQIVDSRKKRITGGW